MPTQEEINQQLRQNPNQIPTGLDPGTQAYLEAARGISPHISVAQFMHPEWRNAYDPSGCPPSHPFRSVKQGGDNACVEKPDNCPDGKTAFGLNECVSTTDPRVGGGGPGAPAAAAAPAAPTTFGAAGTLSYTGNPLIDNLLHAFNTQRGMGGANLFGLGRYGGGEIGPGESPVGSGGAFGRLLPGGGLVWGQASAFNPQTGGPAQPAGAPGAAPPAAPAGPPIASASTRLGGMPVPNPNPASPLTQALLTRGPRPQPKYSSLQQSLLGR